MADEVVHGLDLVGQLEAALRRGRQNRRRARSTALHRAVRGRTPGREPTPGAGQESREGEAEAIEERQREREIKSQWDLGGLGWGAKVNEGARVAAADGG